MKEVVISINSIHDYGNRDEDGLEFTTDGLYSHDGGQSLICYYESDVTGLAGTRTKVSVTEEEIVVDREGSVTGRMVFRKGQRSSFLYDTPYGMATLGVDTRNIAHEFGENGGSLQIDYVVDVAHTVAAKNRFMMNVRELR